MAVIAIRRSSADLATPGRSIVDGSESWIATEVDSGGWNGRGARVRLPLDASSARRLLRVTRWTRMFDLYLGPLVVVMMPFVAIPLILLSSWPATWLLKAAFLGAFVFFEAAILAVNVIVQQSVAFRPWRKGEWIVIKGLDRDAAREWAALNPESMEYRSDS